MTVGVISALIILVSVYSLVLALLNEFSRKGGLVTKRTELELWRRMLSAQGVVGNNP